MSSSTILSEQEQHQKLLAISNTVDIFKTLGISATLPEASEANAFYTPFFRGILSVDHLDRGRVVCSFTVTLVTTSLYNILHAGVVESVAEVVGLACAKTVVGNKELFLGESSTSFLSSAKLHEVVEVTGSVVRQGRNIVVTAVELRIKETRKLVYISRSTLYVGPVSSL